MHYTDLIYTCTHLNGLEKDGLESQAQEMGDRIEVCCGLCGRKRDYPTEALNRESPNLVRESLRGYFEVDEQYVTEQGAAELSTEGL